MVCWPTAQLAAAQGLYEERHKKAPFHDGSFDRWAKERSREFPFHYADGVSFYLAETDENPGDNFLGDSVPEQAPGE